MADTLTTDLPATPIPPVRPPRRLPAALTVEVASDRNEQILWGPTQQRLRGRWDWNNLPRGSTSERGLNKLPTLPGLYIRVDPAARTAEIFDPLTLPQNRPLWDLARREIKDIFNEVREPVPPTRRDRLSDNDLATWMYWILRYHKSGHLRVVSGSLPGVREIAEAFPGARVQRSFYDSLAYGKKEGQAAADVAAEEEDGWTPPEPAAG